MHITYTFSRLNPSNQSGYSYLSKYIFVFNLFQEWKAEGGEVYELIEQVDGFHPNLKAERLAAKALWKTLESNISHVLGKINPYNFLIEAVFGDQGGY